MLKVTHMYNGNQCLGKNIPPWTHTSESTRKWLMQIAYYSSAWTSFHLLLGELQLCTSASHSDLPLTGLSNSQGLVLLAFLLFLLGGGGRTGRDTKKKPKTTHTIPMGISSRNTCSFLDDETKTVQRFVPVVMFPNSFCLAFCDTKYEFISSSDSIIIHQTGRSSSQEEMSSI